MPNIGCQYDGTVSSVRPLGQGAKNRDPLYKEFSCPRFHHDATLFFTAPLFVFVVSLLATSHYTLSCGQRELSNMASNVPVSNGTLPGEQADQSWALNALKSNMILTFGATSLVTLFMWFFISYQTSPLKKYPGPALAGQYSITLGSLIRVQTANNSQDGPTYGVLARYCQANTLLA